MRRISTSRLLLALATCCGAAAGAYAQGTCATAVNLTVGAPATLGTITGTTAQAAPTFTSGCSTSTSTAVRAAYYRFTTGDAGRYTVSGCVPAAANNFDSVMLLWAAGATPCAAGQAVIACNDDSCGSRSSLAADLLANTEYYVRYAAFSTFTTTGDFTIAVSGPSSAPANNTCATAATLPLLEILNIASGSTGGTDSSTTIATCGTGTTTGASAWYSVTMPGLPAGVTSQTYVAAVCGNFDTILSTYTSCAATSSSVCNDDTVPAASFNCALGTGSQLTFTQASTSPTTIFLRVAGLRSNATTGFGVPQAGSFTLSVFTPEANDACANAIALTKDVEYAGNNFTNSSTGDGAASTCTTVNSNAAWFTFTPATDGPYLISTCGSTATRDTVLTVFTAGATCDTTSGGPGIGNTANILACNQDNGIGCSGVRASVQVNLLAGTQYRIRLATGSATAGDYRILVADGVITGACCATNGTCSTTTAAACTSPSVYRGDNTTCPPSPACEQPVACCNPNNASCTLTLESLCVSPNVAQGPGSTCTPTNPCPAPAAPSNSTCAAASPITAGTAVTGTNFSDVAGTSGATASCQLNAGNKDVWFVFSPTTSAVYRFSTCGSTLTGIAGSTQHDTQLVGFRTTDCATGLITANILGCGEDFAGCGTTLNFNSQFDAYVGAGETIYLRLTTYLTTGVGGAYTLLVSETTQTFGACCATSGACSVVVGGSSACLTPSTYRGDGTTCPPSPACPQPVACCDTTTGACTTALPGSCPAGTVEGLAGSTCSPNICLAAPANDDCAGAIALTIGGPATSFQITAQTTASAGYTAGVCSTSSRDLFYSFPALAGTGYRVTITPGTGTGTASVAANFSSTCQVTTTTAGSAGPNFGCNGFATTSVSTYTAIPSTDGTLTVRVADTGSTTIFGRGTILVETVTINACCNTAGVCTLIAGNCPAGQVSIGSTCTPGGCPPAGSCCPPNSTTCSVAFEANCPSAQGFTYGGDGTTCTGVVCPSLAACCLNDGVCVLLTALGCDSLGGTANIATSCTPSPCDAPINTACSDAIALTLNVWQLGNNNLSTTTFPAAPAATCQANSGKEMWYIFTAPATFNVDISTCGSPQDTVIQVYTGDCGTLTAVGCDDDACAGTEPSQIPFAVPSGNGSLITGFAVTQGTVYYVRMTTWGTSNPTGGNFQLRVSGVLPNVVCCRGSTCEFILPADCTPVASPVVGAFVSPAAACGVTNSFTAGCCVADFNKNSNVTIDDIFIYLNAWFDSNIYANVGTPGAPNIDDIFIFLNAWFAGCAPTP